MRTKGVKKGTEVLVVLVCNFVGMTNWFECFFSFVLAQPFPNETQVHTNKDDHT